MGEAVLRVRAGSRVDTPLCRLAARPRGALRLAALRPRLCARGRRRRDDAAGRSDPAAAGGVSRPVVARRRQRQPWPRRSGSAGSSASAFFSPASIGSRRRCLSTSPGSGGWCRLPRPGCRPDLRIYIGLALFAARLAVKYLRLPATARVCAFAVAWSVAEWVRGHALTGLPWNLIGYAWSGGFPGALAMLQSDRLGRHLRAQLRDRARRLVAGAARRAGIGAGGPRRDAGRRRSPPGC